MSDVSNWSPTDASNSATPPDGFPEGMPASAVNNSARAVMGAVRRLAEDGGWFDWGHAATYVSGTTFQVPGDLSSIYTVGRRVRAAQTATITGTIDGVAVSANTDVSVAWDGGASLSNEAMSVSVGLSTSVTPAEAVAGIVLPFAGASVPSGWLLANGQAVSRTTYPALFAVIGTTYGAGDGSTTFNVPDLVDRTAIGAGQSSDAGEGGGPGTARTLGEKVGAETHTLTVNQMPGHNHSLPLTILNVTDGGGTGRNHAIQGSGQVSGSTGGGASHNNMQPSLVMNWIIKT